jgi:hypothetical protein
MATPSVWEEEELRRDGAAAAGERTIAGRTPWQLLWLRFRRITVASLVVDVLYAFLDPRVRYS